MASARWAPCEEGSQPGKAEVLFDRFRRDARQSFKLGTGFCFRLGNAGHDRGHRVVFGLAGKFEVDTVRIIEIDAEQSRELWDRPDIVDAARNQPRLDLTGALGRDDEGAMLNGTDGVAVAGWLASHTRSLAGNRYDRARSRYPELDQAFPGEARKAEFLGPRSPPETFRRPDGLPGLRGKREPALHGFQAIADPLRRLSRRRRARRASA